MSYYSRDEDLAFLAPDFHPAVPISHFSRYAWFRNLVWLPNVQVREKGGPEFKVQCNGKSEQLRWSKSKSIVKLPLPGGVEEVT